MHFPPGPAGVLSVIHILDYFLEFLIGLNGIHAVVMVYRLNF